MGGSLTSVLRWPLDLGLPSLAALPPPPPPPAAAAAAYASALHSWQPEQLGAALRRAVPRWPELLDLPVVDTVLWSVVTALESVVLVSMMCCFFLFCGCTL